MGSANELIRLSFLVQIIPFLILSSFCTVSHSDYVKNYCNYDYLGTYTSNSTFQKNLDSIASSLNTDSSFYNFSVGESPDTAYVTALCRGDVSPSSCRDCLKGAYANLRGNCTNQKQAIVWYDECMLRYSDLSMFHKMETVPNVYTFNDELVPNTSTTKFNQAVIGLLDNLTATAASRGGAKLATGNAIATDGLKVYALVECNPDLNSTQCISCLQYGITEKLPICCSGKKGGRVLTPSCNLRYEMGAFYSETNDTLDTGANDFPGPSPPSTPLLPPGKDDNIPVIIVAILVPTLVSMAIANVVVCILFRRKLKHRHKHKYPWDEKSDNEARLMESLRYDFKTIRQATRDFSDDNQIGQGGFGAVYKGILPNGKKIAVKRLYSGSTQGELELEFKNEVIVVAKLQHRSLVELLGFCLEGKERLLIYEFLPNTSLDLFILDPAKRAGLDWDVRYKIIKGIARGLLYLHEDCRVQIIHRDLKASNILLDNEMNPKIADFGTARMFTVEDTHFSATKVAGTLGYMAPEYVSNKRFSVKSDVFSFGILVLEIISGQRNSDFQVDDAFEYLSSYAWRSWHLGTASGVIDQALVDCSAESIQDMMRCIHISLLCVQNNADVRPTMASVVIMLNSSSTLPVPLEPAFYMYSREMPIVSAGNSTMESSHSRSMSSQGSDQILNREVNTC